MKDIPVDRGAFITLNRTDLKKGPTSRPLIFESLHSLLSLHEREGAGGGGGGGGK